MKRMRVRDADWRGRVVRALLTFWDTQRRDLPWRRDADVYRVWVSEIMLQQTRVEAVIPYYNRWMARFPTLASLAAAPLDDVLLAWQGLGYYGRARNLHVAARRVMRETGGAIPRDAAGLRKLPGVGGYTAGAIASIAFGQAVPAVDGNVRRVLARLLDLTNPSARELHAVAADLVPEDRPGDFNQALMELGATVCTPRAPACGGCPVSRVCLAARRGTQGDRPLPRPARQTPGFDVGTALIVATGDRLLLTRRPEHGLLAGLWALPGAVTRPGETLRQAARRAAREAGARVDGRAARALGVVRHAFTHRRENYHAFRFRARTPLPLPSADTIWASRADLDTLPMPVAQRRIIGLTEI